MNKLNVLVTSQSAGVLHKGRDEFVFNYVTDDPKSFVSLTMPVRAKSYVMSHFLPIFEMHLPEGYLLSVIKKHFSKLTDTDDFGLLCLLSNSVKGRLHYVDAANAERKPLHLDDLLHPQSTQLFNELVTRFALMSPLSGVQPKVLAQIEDKATLKLESVIVKAWGDDYSELALNEFLCMSVVRAAGISVPDFYLSDDERLFIMRRFDQKDDGSYLGFEDMCVLQAKQRDHKYQGSYESVAKTIKLFTSPANKYASLQQFFKMMLLNYLLQNGDAHLKNFGVVYDDMQHIRLAPAYDVVSTTFYIKQDVPSLTLAGSKRWHQPAQLLNFGVEACELTVKEAQACYIECLGALSQVGQVIQQRLITETKSSKRQLLLHLQAVMSAVNDPSSLSDLKEIYCKSS